MCNKCLLTFLIAGVRDATENDDDALLRSFIMSVRQTEMVKIFETVAEPNVAMISECYLGDLVQMTWYAGFQTKENQDLEHKVSLLALV